ncbi:MAG: phosphate ABC transporter permease PstA [Gammaproteobacteria bacterium]|nr:phosphate ABC transporter permease PstA [Gammaproteobacteria bacterium]
MTPNPRPSFTHWLKSGNPWVWMTAGAVSLSLVMVFGLLLIIAINGLAHFWPARVAKVVQERADGTHETLLGEFVDAETVTAARVRDSGGRVPPDATVVKRLLLKVGNRDLGDSDFRWVPEPEITTPDYPAEAVVIERSEWGNFYGFITGLSEHGKALDGANVWAELAPRLQRGHDLREQIAHIEKREIGSVNYQLEQLRLRERVLGKAGDTAGQQALLAPRAVLEARFAALSDTLAGLNSEIKRDGLLVTTVTGVERTIPIEKIVRLYRPNQMRWREKIAHYCVKLGEFVSDEPREANTEGGVFPAIFGTVLMVMVMSVLVTPFGVIAAVYLREYAKPGPITSAIRIAVNNLAGVPSVVYGVFGFGFFVYFLGGNIDRLFFADKLPAPTFGTPGLLWSALTLALLTVPVVIVATEEGLARIPRAIREGSLALGATKAETLWRTVLPMATPAMMTGLILAVARAAGEVAPLMMVGVVKLAPSLPLDGDFPYLHLDRKFMHLGFHIFDVGFQSPNVEAARPLVYATALLLVVIIMSLNLAAIQIRNRLREKYNAADH